MMWPSSRDMQWDTLLYAPSHERSGFTLRAEQIVSSMTDRTPGAGAARLRSHWRPWHRPGDQLPSKATLVCSTSDSCQTDGIERHSGCGLSADIATTSGSAAIGVVFIPSCQQGVPKPCQLTAALCPRRASIPDINISIDFIAGGIGG